MVDVERGEHARVPLTPSRQLRLGAQRLGDLVGEPRQLFGYRLAHRPYAAVPFARDEADVGGVGADVRGDHLDGAVDALLGAVLLGEDRADHGVQAVERLLDQRDAEVGHVPEVPVEGGRGDADDAGDLAQPEAAEALVLQEEQARVEERLTGLLLLGLPDPGRVTHIIQ